MDPALARCVACSGTSAVGIGVQDGYPWLGCPTCGSAFVEQTSIESTPSLYDSHYDEKRFGPAEGAVLASLERLARQAERSRRTGRWMDIGFGGGALLHVVSRLGWQPFGTERATSALEAARRLGWTAASEPHDDPRFPEAGFDVVSLVEVAEHVPDANPLFALAWRYLRPGGVLFITTPNGASLNRRLFGIGWDIFAAPDHVVIWSPRGLRRALERRGFRDIRIRTHGLNPAKILARFRRRQAAAQGPNYGESGRALNRSLGRDPLGRLAKDIVNSALSVLRLGDTLKVWTVKPTEPIEADHA